VFRHRTAAVTATLHDLARKLGDCPLDQPVVPGTSPLGLTLWHVPRTQDWLVSTSIRGVPEVAEEFRDGLPDPDVYGFGVGLTDEQSREAAAQVQVPALLAYADAVAASVDAWLSTLCDRDLDEVPPFLENQSARAPYTSQGSLDEVAGLAGQPVGVLLMRPAMGHLFWHLGELDLLLQLAKAAS
jgi:hypothetical protein